MNILRMYKSCRLIPFGFGNSLFSVLLGWKVPYTSSIRPEVVRLEAGRVEVAMRDRKSVRNHLRSVHAVAMMNLGEAASGLAVISTLSENEQAILTRFEIDFLKKARGRLTAKASFSKPPKDGQSQSVEVVAVISNTKDEVVAHVNAHWLVGEKRK